MKIITWNMNYESEGHPQKFALENGIKWLDSHCYSAMDMWLFLCEDDIKKPEIEGYNVVENKNYKRVLKDCFPLFYQSQFSLIAKLKHKYLGSHLWKEYASRELKETDGIEIDYKKCLFCGRIEIDKIVKKLTSEIVNKYFRKGDTVTIPKSDVLWWHLYADSGLSCTNLIIAGNTTVDVTENINLSSLTTKSFLTGTVKSQGVKNDHP